MWRGHFHDVFNNVSYLTDKQCVEDRINCMVSAHHITNPGDTEEAIDDLNTGKCAGLDNSNAENLENAVNVLNVLLFILWTTMMKHVYDVSKIVETVIIPVMRNKSGDTSDKHNYRSLAIITTMSKVLELLLLHKIGCYLIINFLINLSTVTNQLHKSLTMYTPALVQDQNILDFLPYPPKAFLNTVRAKWETQCSLLYYSRDFSFSAILPYMH